MSDDRLKISEIAYFLFAAVLFMAKGLSWYDGQREFKICLVIAVGFWAVKMLFTKYSLQEFIIITVLLALAAVSYKMSGDKGLLMCAFVITGAKGIDIKKMFRGWIKIWSFFCILTILMYLFGITDGFIRQRNKYGFGIVYSNGLGYTNHSVLHITYMAFTLMVIYVCFDHITSDLLRNLMLGNILIFVYSFSVSGFIGTTLAILVTGIYCRKEMKGKEHRALYFLSESAVPVCIAFALLTPLLPENGRMFHFIDIVLNGRLKYAADFMHSGLFTPFGCRIYELLDTNVWQYYIDSSYVGGLAEYGAVSFLVFILLYFLVIRKMSKNHMNAELVITLPVLVTGLAEPLLFNTSFKNISLFMVGEALFMGGINMPYFNLSPIKLLSDCDKKVKSPFIEWIIYSERPQLKNDTAVYKIARYTVGCMAVVPFIVSLADNARNVFTRPCGIFHQLSALRHPEGIRGVIMWYIIGFYGCMLIEIIIDKAKRK